MSKFSDFAVKKLYFKRSFNNVSGNRSPLFSQINFDQTFFWGGLAWGVLSRELLSGGLCLGGLCPKTVIAIKYAGKQNSCTGCP